MIKIKHPDTKVSCKLHMGLDGFFWEDKNIWIPKEIETYCLQEFNGIRRQVEAMILLTEKHWDYYFKKDQV